MSRQRITSCCEPYQLNTKRTRRDGAERGDGMSAAFLLCLKKWTARKLGGDEILLF